VLSERAFSRWRHRTSRRLDRTRGDQREGCAVPVRLHTLEGLRELCAGAGLEVVRATGMNVLSGAAEFTSLWGAGRRAADRYPDRAHTIEALLRKEAPRREGT
jgi:hypothetical protein